MSNNADLPPVPPDGAFIEPRSWLKRLVRATLRPRPLLKLWQWLEKFFVIPSEVDSPKPGPYRTSNFPPMRGLFEMLEQRGVHFFSFCSSARIGKTLFSIAVLCWWIAERLGTIVWLEPTRKSALRLVRSELEYYLLQCKPVRALAIIAKTTWTALEKQFVGKVFRIVPSGAEADLHGYQARCIFINESDRCKQWSAEDRDAASADKVIARSRQFAHERLIIRNSTPTEEWGDIWVNFLAGSQHHCYLPCPHCSGDAAAAVAREEKEHGSATLPAHALRDEVTGEILAGFQRLTFFPEQRDVPFDLVGRSLPAGEKRPEQTGFVRFDRFAIYKETKSREGKTEQTRIGYNISGVETGATYCCAHCQRDIEWVDLNGFMLSRFRWWAHNASELRDKSHVSAHLSALYSPFEFWGVLAVEFLNAKGSAGKLIKFETLTLGRPNIRHRAAVKEEDLDRVIARCPVQYSQGELPFEPLILAMTIDRQGDLMKFVIRAWGLLWDHPDRPTVSALIDWGECLSWEHVEELAGLRQRADGTFRRFTWALPDGTVREYHVTTGLIDSGFEARVVYEFCLKWPGVFSPYKGGEESRARGGFIYLAKILDDRLDLVWAWSNHFAGNLYYAALRDGRNSVGDLIHWWLPVNIDSMYRKELTSEREVEEMGKMIWKKFDTNDLGDCEKEQEVLRPKIEELCDAWRKERAADEADTAGEDDD